jgi:hypothetical protein
MIAGDRIVIYPVATGVWRSTHSARRPDHDVAGFHRASMPDVGWARP